MKRTGRPAVMDDRPPLSRALRLSIWFLVPPLLAVAGAWLAEIPTLQRYEWSSIDARFRRRGPLKPDPRIVIVELDEPSRERLKQPDWQFKLRHYMDDAITNLANAGAICIGVDIIFDGRSDDEHDANLAAIIAESNVVLAAAYTAGRSKLPADVFLNAMPALGLISVEPDPDGVLRRLSETPYMDYIIDAEHFVRIPHFPFVLADFLIGESYFAEGKEPPLSDYDREGYGVVVDRKVYYGRLVNFAGGPGDGFATISFADAVEHSFDVDAVNGSIVIIGPTRSIEDQFTLPLAERLVPGVYYHANVLNEIVQDRPLAEWPETSRRRWLVIAVATISGWYFWWLRDWWKRRRGWLRLAAYFAIGAIVVFGGWWFACQAAFERDVVLPQVPPLFASGLVALGGFAAQASLTVVSARRLSERNRFVESLFGRNVSQVMLDAIKRDPSSVAAIEVRDVSVLFCDIRGFTATSTAMTPREVADMLNEYFEAITGPVFEQDGFIDKFVGDELMAVFGVPLDQADHALRAAQSAMGIKASLASLNAKRAERGQKALDCGVGIHCGPAAAGYIGSGKRANYTVVGDTVNMAARIESQTSSGEILMSEAMRDRLGDSVPVRVWKTVELKGADRAFTLYELLRDSTDTGAPGGAPLGASGPMIS